MGSPKIDLPSQLAHLVYEEADLQEGDEDEEERRGAEAALASIGRCLDVSCHHLK